MLPLKLQSLDKVVNLNFVNIRIFNLEKNVKLIEEETGLRMYYVLACPVNFPNKTFFSNKKWWYKKTMLIPYGNEMSRRLNYAYMKLKCSTMVDLALFHQQLANEKVSCLLLQQQYYLEYK